MPTWIITTVGHARALVQPGSWRHNPGVEAIVSILGEGIPTPEPLAQFPGPSLRLSFDDIESDKSRFGYSGATLKDVERLIEFGPLLKDKNRVLIHCSAGESRSSACMLALLRSYGLSAKEACDVLDESVTSCIMKGWRPHENPGVAPNRRVLWLSDQLLGGESFLPEVERRYWEPFDQPPYVP